MKIIELIKALKKAKAWETAEVEFFYDNKPLMVELKIIDMESNFNHKEACIIFTNKNIGDKL